MSDMYSATKTTYLYVGSSIVIILLLFLIVQAYYNDEKLIKDINKNYAVLVKTPKGLVRSDNESVAQELEYVKHLLISNHAGAQTSCVNLIPKINTAMKNLAKFIKDNPDNAKSLCNLELKAEVVNQYLADSITPESRDWRSNYKSLLDWEHYERDLPSNPVEKLNFLIKNIDVAVKLLRFNVCNNGQIDLETLHNILLDLNEQICISGSMYTPDGGQITYGYDPYTKYNRPPPLPLFIQTQSTLEPFENKETEVRSLPPKGSFGKLNIKKEKFIIPYVPSELESDDRLVPTNDFSGVTKEIDVADQSFEGSVERDILGYKPPGHIISQLYDPTDHYTVNVNACGGKIVSDENLIRECVSKDIKLIDALRGDSSKMLDCIGNCDEEPNYYRWYSKLNNAIQDMEFIHGNEDNP